MNALFCALDKKKNFIKYLVVRVLKKYGINLRLSMKGQIKLKSLKLVDIRQYELFQMEQNESVYSMYMNTLGSLGKTFSKSEKVNKIIRSLLKEWRPKRIAIEEIKNLNTLPFDDLIGSLISYEKYLADMRRKRKTLLSKFQNIRVMTKVSWMMRRWLC